MAVTWQENLQYFEETLKPRIQDLFSRSLVVLSPPFNDFVQKYRDGTIEQIKNDIKDYEFKANPHGLHTIDLKRNFLRSFTDRLDSFIKGVKRADDRYKEFLGAMNRLLLDNTNLLRVDKEIASMVNGYLESEKQHFFSNTLSSPIIKSPGYSIGVLEQTGSLRIEFNFFAFFEPYIKRIDEMEKVVKSTVEQAVSLIKKQENFIQERVAHQDQVPLQIPLVQNLSPTSHKAVPPSTQQTTTLPVVAPSAYSPEDHAIVKSLQSEREKLLRTLQSIT